MATLRGTQNNDVLIGGAEDDEIFGLGGADRLSGGPATTASSAAAVAT